MGRTRTQTGRHASRRRRRSSTPGTAAGTLSPRQAALLQLQRTHGNGFVQRRLADLQREEAAQQKSGASDDGFSFDQWITGQVYDLLKKELGDAKLKKYAGQLADKASTMLMEPVAGSEGAATLTEEQLKKVGKELNADLAKALEEIFKSPAGQKIRQTLLKWSRDPDKALGMALLGLAAFVATNQEIPELKKKVELGAGFSAGAAAKLGKIQSPELKKIETSLAFASKYFNAGLTGTYQGSGEQEGFSGKAHAAVGTEEARLKADATVSPDGNFGVDMGGVLDFKEFKLSGGASWNQIKGWSGVGEMRFGGDNVHVASKVMIANDGKINFSFGPQFTTDWLKLAATVSGGNKDETQLSASAAVSHAFGVHNLSIAATMLAGLDDPLLQKVGLQANYKILDKSAAAGPLLFITLDAKASDIGQAKMPAGEAYLLLRADLF